MTITKLIKPLKAKRAFEEIADQIKQLAYSGQLKPGDKLPSEKELTNLFHAGRMVIRESLRTLEQAGFIYIKKGYGGGAFIKNADTKVVSNSITDMVRLGNISLSDLTEARVGIEMLILDLACQRIDDNDLCEIRENIDYTRDLITRGMIRKEGNINFHILLAKASKNPVLEMMIESLMNVTISFITLLAPDVRFSKEILEYHEHIYEAIKQKDLSKAKKLMEAHILDVGAKLLQLADTHDSPDIIQNL